MSDKNENDKTEETAGNAAEKPTGSSPASPGAPVAGAGGSARPMPSQPRTFVSKPLVSRVEPEKKADQAAAATPETQQPEKASSPAGAGAGAATGSLPKPGPGPAKKSAPAAAGGDTLRLRVTPKPKATSTPGSTFPTAAVPRPSRLPDIRRRQAAPRATPQYGPFSLFFGFFWLIFKMLFFTILILALAAAAGYGILHWYVKTPQVTVPNVRGMKVAEAFDVLSEKQLGMIKVRSESSGLVAPGEIIEQNPQAGSTTKEGRAVGVVVSSGRSRYMVPNVVGESIDNARNKIKGAGLEVGNELRLEDPNVPKEAVISQQPAANTGLDDPVKVDLLVSAGQPGKSLTMPDLTNRSLAEAKAALSRLGITDIVTEPPDATPDAAVTSQQPLVGKSVFQTDRVTLTTRR